MTGSIFLHLFSFWSVVRSLSGRITLSRIFLVETLTSFFESITTAAHTLRMRSQCGIYMWALKKSFKVAVSTMYFSLDRRKTRLECFAQCVICVSHRQFVVYNYSKQSVFCPLVHTFTLTCSTQITAIKVHN